jgi:hypothetical protein
MYLESVRKETSRRRLHLDRCLMYSDVLANATLQKPSPARGSVTSSECLDGGPQLATPCASEQRPNREEGLYEQGKA